MIVAGLAIDLDRRRPVRPAPRLFFDEQSQKPEKKSRHQRVIETLERSNAMRTRNGLKES
jgi:hypothetical protein